MKMKKVGLKTTQIIINIYDNIIFIIKNGQSFFKIVRFFYLQNFYIFLLYCPPTSNNALVICPNEQVLVAVIKCSNIFSCLMAAF